MNISLPETLKAFVDGQVSERGYATSSEYIRALIRHERDREKLRGLLDEGAASPLTEPMDEADFEELRQIARSQSGG